MGDAEQLGQGESSDAAADDGEEPLVVVAKEARSAENPLEKIEELLTCSICLERYKSPKLLPCQHTFCLPCLDSYSDTVLRKLKCPECRAEHTIDPYEGVKALPTNYTMAQFLEIHLEASEENSEALNAYIQRYNLERCKVCDEKEQLSICAHCERKVCDECRKTHVEMMKRDLGRMLNQVKRLSNRVKEASEGLGKGLDTLVLNGESTKAEITEYFHRYSRELKRREEHFLAEVEAFVQSEGRLMRTLKDTLDVEYREIQDACVLVENIMIGARESSDSELARVKTIFVDGLDYLRNFRPDSDDLFGKRLRFTPGDDSAKLPSAIANFGELLVALPQFSNRYLPLEAQYLPRPFRLGIESDYYRVSKRAEMEDAAMQRFSGMVADEGLFRYKRRQQLEDEAWNRLEAPTSTAGSSPGRGPSPINPWRDRDRDQNVDRPAVVGANSPLRATTSTRTETDGRQKGTVPAATEKSNLGKVKGGVIPAGRATTDTAAKGTKLKPNQPQPSAAQRPANPQSGTAAINKASPGGSSQKAMTAAASRPSASGTTASSTTGVAATKSTPGAKKMGMTRDNSKPPLAKAPQSGASSSQDDTSLNDKVECIKSAHERRMREKEQQPPQPPQHAVEKRPGPVAAAANSRGSPRRTSRIGADRQNSQDDGDMDMEQHSDARRPPKYKSRIISRRSSSSKPALNSAAKARSMDSDDGRETAPSTRREDETALSIPIAHYAGSLDKRNYYSRRSVPVGGDDPPDKSASSRQMGVAMPTPNMPSNMRSQTATGVTNNNSAQERRSRFTRRSSMELSQDGDGTQDAPASSSTTTTRAPTTSLSSAIHSPFIDYSSKQRPRLVFGRRGSQPDEMHWPRGVAAMPGGEFAVCDSSNHRVQIFNSNGKLLRAFGSYGTTAGDFDSCAGIAYNRFRQQLIVTDRYNHRVQIFDLEGKFVKQFGSVGNRNAQFNNPWGVALDELGLLYVVDKDNHRVQVFDQNGNFMSKFGSLGEETNQFNHPLYISIHKRSQNIYISDSANHRICVYSHDCHPLSTLGREGFHSGELKLPRGVAVDEQEFCIVADSGNNRIQVFAQDGRTLKTFGAWGTAHGQLKGVEGVALLGSTIVVTDRENHRVQLF